MAKLRTLKIVDRAATGATVIIRDRMSPTVKGVHPPLLAADGSPVTLTLLGADSRVAKRLGYQRAAAAQNRLYASAFSPEKNDTPRGVVTPDDVAEQEQFDIERLTALTIGWHGFEDDDDQPVAFTTELVRELYEQNPDVREQAMQFVENRAAFFGPSSTPSADSSTINSA